MARYIDADALFEPNESTDKVLVLGRNGGKTIALAEKMMRERVNMAPTLTIDDLRPKGRWIPSHSEGYNPEYDLWFEWECSECHNNFANDEDEIPYNFCPNCGADMRRGGEDG